MTVIHVCYLAVYHHTCVTWSCTVILYRYYLKSNSATETVVPPEGVQELLREAQVSLLQLQSAEVAAQLTLRDFQLFRDIEPTEFVDDIFELESRFGTSHLAEFSAVSCFKLC